MVIYGYTFKIKWGKARDISESSDNYVRTETGWSSEPLSCILPDSVDNGAACQFGVFYFHSTTKVSEEEIQEMAIRIKSYLKEKELDPKKYARIHFPKEVFNP